MAKYSLDNARPLGAGHHAPPGSITDPELAAAISRYKRGVASRYEALLPDELPVKIGPGPYLVSPKIDGEQWCLVLDDGDAFFANPNGRVLAGDIPVLAEARKMAKRSVNTTVLAGELFAALDEGRTRHGDLAAALRGDQASPERVAFRAFDVVWGGDATARMPIGEYEPRLELLRRLLDGGERIKPVATEVVTDPDAIATRFRTLVTDGGAEGLVVRTKAAKVFKVKPSLTLDAAVIGYTERSTDANQAGSFLLALIGEDGRYQVLGHCGNLGSEEARRGLIQKVIPLRCDSNFSEANSKGALFQFVRPELVVEVRVTDVQGESAGGGPLLRMVLDHEDGRWRARQRLPGVSILHPRLERLREDKRAIAADVPLRQVLERVTIPELDKGIAVADLPKAEILRREVYVKTTKGKTAVRKLVMWKTNKHEHDPAHPAFVIHFTDYSPGRKDPLKRTVRLAPELSLATAIADEMIADEIKKGWNPA